MAFRNPLLFAALMIALVCPGALPAESPPINPGPLPGVDAFTPPPDNPEAKKALEDYNKEILAIEEKAAEEKMQAGKRLQDRLAALAQAASGQLQPGLIGTAVIKGENTAIAYHYHHGKVFPPELIRERFHKGQPPFPFVTITLVGYVDVPQDMTVLVWHGAGGVSADHGELQIGDRVLGKVGDDIAKSEIYAVNLPSGRLPIRWTLTGGTFQPSLLKIVEPRTGELLSVGYDQAQKQATGAAKAAEIIEAKMPASDWAKTSDPREWHWKSLGNLNPDSDSR